MPGLGTIGGGLLGGVLGAFGGDYLAQSLAEYLMGETSEIEELAKNIQAASGSTGLPGERRRESRGGLPTAIPATQGAQIADGTTTTRELDFTGSNGGGSFAVNAPTSNVSNNTSLVSHGLGTSDNQDSLMESRYG